MSWEKDLAHLNLLESQGDFKEAIAFKKEKGIMELFEIEEEKLSNLKE